MIAALFVLACAAAMVLIQRCGPKDPPHSDYFDRKGRRE